MPFQDRFPGVCTPHRVFALCKLVGYGRYTREELKDYLIPMGVSGQDRGRNDRFRSVFNLAMAGDLIETDPDGKIMLRLPEVAVSSPESFRQAVANQVFSRPHLMFCRFTSWYFARNTQVLGESSADLYRNFNREMQFGDQDLNAYNDTNIAAWRPWAAYLGLGYIHDKVLIPNGAERIGNALKGSPDLPRKKTIPFAQFMNWLNRTCPELDYGAIFMANLGAAKWGEQRLTFGLSAGLRTLHDMGRLQMTLTADATDLWHLTPSLNHPISQEVSEITILEEEGEEYGAN